jgi:hypothetical protein
MNTSLVETAEFGGGGGGGSCGTWSQLSREGLRRGPKLTRGLASNDTVQATPQDESLKTV